MKQGTRAIRAGVLGALLTVLAANYLPLFMYFTNADEVAFREILPLVGIFSGLSLLLYAAFLLLARSPWKAAVAAALGALIATNYAYIEKVFFLLPIHLRYWHVVALVVFLFAHLAYFIIKKLSADHAQTGGQVLLIVLAGLLAVNLITAVPAIVGKMSVSMQSRASQNDTADPTTGDDALPNIYYFIFDEFSSKATMEKCYGYSNDTLFQALEEMGFTVSYDSHNMSHSTITVTTNYINYDYLVTDGDSQALKIDIRRDNATAKLMQQHGYQLRFLGAGAGVGDFGIAENTILATNTNATTVGGTTLYDMILERTLVYPFIDATGKNNVVADQINEVFQYFSVPGNYPTEQPTYTLVYVESPHEPFLFTADGAAVNPKNYRNWSDPDYYLGQYMYISRKMEEAVRQIIAHDPEAVIILQSDHSARWAPSVETSDMSSILNAIYYRGDVFDDFLGKSGVNTLRALYSKLFGLALEDVEVNE